VSTTEQPQIIRLCRRQTVWQASDREGRVLAVINLTFMVINLALIMINAWLGLWWITPISLCSQSPPCGRRRARSRWARSGEPRSGSRRRRGDATTGVGTSPVTVPRKETEQ